MTEEKFLDVFRIYIITKFNSKSAAARHWEVSHQFVGQVIAGNKNPTKRMLADIGYEREAMTVTKVRYKKV
jgi:hypothetical protein